MLWFVPLSCHLFISDLKNHLLVWKPEWWKGREKQTEGEREIKREGRKSFCIIGHSPNAYGRQGCSWLKSRAKNSVLVPHVGDMNPNTWAIISHLPGALEGSQVEVGIRIPPALWYGTQEAACLAATMPSPSVYFCEYKRPHSLLAHPMIFSSGHYPYPSQNSRFRDPTWPIRVLLES